MNEYVVVLTMRVSGEYANPKQWDWEELLHTGPDLEVISVEIQQSCNNS